jgi:hypothetical protein
VASNTSHALRPILLLLNPRIEWNTRRYATSSTHPTYPRSQHSFCVERQRISPSHMESCTKACRIRCRRLRFLFTSLGRLVSRDESSSRERRPRASLEPSLPVQRPVPRSVFTCMHCSLQPIHVALKSQALPRQNTRLNGALYLSAPSRPGTRRTVRALQRHRKFY